MTTASKKSVTFSPTITGMQVMSIYDYTPSEISAAWYNQEEMDHITNRCFKIILRMESGRSNRKICTRGLEGHSTLGSISKKKEQSNGNRCSSGRTSKAME
mmetsp:Transcript_33007/g.79825  ORF Transcript_33007/g.79825 Transcript_33007/m.79825 type:complete len:101 (-) Transcript_33007:426-728(-)